MICLTGDKPGRDHYFHWLLRTDTAQGKVAAELLEEWLQACGAGVQILNFRGLATRNLLETRVAMAELAKFCAEHLPAYRESGYSIVFNVTGGFKAIQGFVQTLGMLYADECVYVFERQDELIRIPRLPLCSTADQVFEENLPLVRRLGLGFDVLATECQGLPETLLLEIDGSTILSEYGQLLWQEAKRRIYAKQLHPSWSERIEFSPGFERDVASQSPDRICLVNERVDQLTHHLMDPQFNPASLDFKAVKGTPGKDRVYECDAWSDRDAKRIYCHFEGATLVLDKLGDHL